MRCLSCCAGPLWAWYPGLAASSISCQVAACCPPSHGKSFNQCFLCYSLVNYFLGCLQVHFPAGLLSSGLRHSCLQVPLQRFSLTPNQSCWCRMAGMDVETLPWSRRIYLGKFSHFCNFSTILYLSQEESHLDNYNLDPPTAQSQVLAPYTVDASSSLISVGDLHSVQVIRRAVD